MKRVFFLLIVLVLYSCDPVGYIMKIIVNNTMHDINLIKVSSESEPDTLHIKSHSILNIGETGGVNVDFSAYDSVIVKSNNRILKVYKPDIPGKNIYNIDRDWEYKAIDKRRAEYLYIINPEDLD